MAAAITSTSLFSFFTASLTAFTYLFSFFNEFSSTLQTYKTGLDVINCNFEIISFSSSFVFIVLAGFPFSMWLIYLFVVSIIFCASLSPDLAVLIFLSRNFSRFSKSFNCNSISIVFLSLIGSIDPSTWTILSLSKHLKTWIIALVSLIFPKNLFPRPSPLLAPLTSPAISTISTVVATILSGFTISDRAINLSSGTDIIPILGSIVQNGKFADCAFALDKQLNNVDFPTFGNPTMPHFKAIININLKFHKYITIVNTFRR